MDVGRNLTYTAHDGGWSKVYLALSEEDLFAIVGEKKVEGWHIDDGAAIEILNDQGEVMPLLLRYKVLQAYCDILVWAQVASEGGASPEFAKQKMTECIARTGGILRV